MTGSHPYPSLLLVLAALSVLPFLGSCTAEPPATPPGSTGAPAPVVPGGGPAGNHPPSVLSAGIYPGDVTLDTELRVDIHGEDLDGDRVTYQYQWVVNGVPAPGAKSDTLETKEFQKKDVLEVLVTPSDGKSTGEGQGVQMLIENSHPRFTSTPPTEIKDGQYSYQVVVTDPDEDPITLELKQGPPGMTLDPATKQLSWKLTPENLGKHQVVLVAKDNDNGATQVEFDLDALPPKP